MNELKRAMHNKTLSETLLFNAQISKVELKNICSELSDNAHGLFIKSTENDCYIDLRLFKDKPFWGHSHPLVIQDKFGKLPAIKESSELYSLEKKAYQSMLKDRQRVSLININDSNSSKIHLLIDQNILFLTNDKIKALLNKLNNLKVNKDIIVEEKNIPLLSSKSLFLTEGLNLPTIINLEALDLLLVKDHDPQEALKQPLVSSMHRYLNKFIFCEQGKLETDYATIDNFLKSNLAGKCERFGSYLQIKTEKSQKVINEFLRQGIVITADNFKGDTLILALPLSCTKSELLDTLERINKLCVRL